MCRLVLVAVGVMGPVCRDALISPERCRLISAEAAWEGAYEASSNLQPVKKQKINLAWLQMHAIHEFSNKTQICVLDQTSAYIT